MNRLQMRYYCLEYYTDENKLPPPPLQTMIYNAKNTNYYIPPPLQTSIPGNRGVSGGIAFSVDDPLTRYPFPQSTASTCCTTLVNELTAPTHPVNSEAPL